MNVMLFTNYRSFLHSALDEAKRKNPRLSATSFARRLGLKSNSSLIKILRGQRDAGPDIRMKVGRYFKFSHREQAYFNDLVSLSKVESDSTKSVFLMTRMKKMNRLFRVLREDEFSTIANWWFYAIRQMAKLPDFDERVEVIARRLQFKVSRREIRRTIDVMLNLGLLERYEGRLRATAKSLDTSNGVASEALKRFHEGMIANAGAAIRTVDVQNRYIAGVTLSIRRDDLVRAQAVLGEFLDRFNEEFEVDSNPDAVYQMQLQFFPLMKFNELKK